MSTNQQVFGGCKIALFYQGALLVYRRDNRDDIPFPGMLDFPGGGREGDETPEQCILRELREEFSLCIPASRLGYRQLVSPQVTKAPSYFFAAALAKNEVDLISFGEEGQYWQFITPAAYLNHPDAIPGHQTRLRRYLSTARETQQEVTE